MISLTSYFEYKEDIKNILIIIEHDSSQEHIVKICETIPAIQKIYLAGTSKSTISSVRLAIRRALRKKDTSTPPEIFLIPYIKKIDYEFSDKIDAILFDAGCTRTALLSVKYLQPMYLVGKIWRDFVPAFNIWEEYRTICKHMHIKCVGKGNKVDIINWDKKIDNDIEISVVFPVYNVAEYLNKCITSVTAWKAPYIEFLFVNDGSPDNSRDIILEYQKKDPRIKLIDKPNGGCASARKRGMEEAKGRYIGFIDPDDFVDVDMFKKLFRRALIGNYEVSYCGYNAYYEDIKKIERIDDALGLPYVAGTTDKLAIRKLIMYLRVAIWRGIYRADFLRENHITFQENLRRFDDLPFKIEVCAKARSVVAVPEFLYYYRLGRPGQDMACDDDRLYVHFDIFDHLNKEIGALNDRKLLDFLQMSKIQTHCFAFQRIQKKYLKEYCQKAKKDFKSNHMTVFRTLLLLYKYFGKANMLAYISIMTNLYGPYARYLEMKHVRNN